MRGQSLYGHPAKPIRLAESPGEVSQGVESRPTRLRIGGESTRRLRIEFDGTTFRAMARGNARQVIERNDDDRARLLLDSPLRSWSALGYLATFPGSSVPGFSTRGQRNGARDHDQSIALSRLMSTERSQRNGVP